MIFCKIFRIFITLFTNIYTHTMTTFQRISAREAYAAYVRGHVLVDVRETDEATEKTVDINHLVSMPVSELDQRLDELPTNRPLVLVSRVGSSSNTAAQFLLQNGYSDVAIVEGGMKEWEMEGLPIREVA